MRCNLEGLGDSGVLAGQPGARCFVITALCALFGSVSPSHPLLVLITSYFSAQDFTELWMKLLFLDYFFFFLSKRK